MNGGREGEREREGEGEREIDCTKPDAISSLHQRFDLTMRFDLTTHRCQRVFKTKVNVLLHQRIFNSCSEFEC